MKGKINKMTTLKLETLEDRTVPAVTANFWGAFGLLGITGDNNDNQIDVELNTVGNSIHVYETVGGNRNQILVINGMQGTPVGDLVQNVTIAMYNGNDIVNFGDIGNPNIMVDVDGGGGNDELQCDLPCTMLGGDGNDVLTGSDYADALNGEDGNDVIYGNGDHDYLYGGLGLDNMEGGDGQDYMEGGEDSDFLKGGNGNDILYGNEGDDLLEGQVGNDELYGGDGEDELFGAFQNGGGNPAEANWLYGEGDDDDLIGSDGSDYMNGGNGNDNMEGGLGGDTLYDDSGSNTFDGGAGHTDIINLFWSLGVDNVKFDANDIVLGFDSNNDIWIF